MAWRRPGDKPWSETMMVRLLAHVCVTRPQWVNWCISCNQKYVTHITNVFCVREFVYVNEWPIYYWHLWIYAQYICKVEHVVRVSPYFVATKQWSLLPLTFEDTFLTKQSITKQIGKKNVIIYGTYCVDIHHIYIATSSSFDPSQRGQVIISVVKRAWDEIIFHL